MKVIAYILKNYLIFKTSKFAESAGVRLKTPSWAKSNSAYARYIFSSPLFVFFTLFDHVEINEDYISERSFTAANPDSS